MTRIDLTPDEIIDVSSQLNAKAEEINNATSTANSQVNRIRGMLSDRLQADIESWDSLQKNILQAVENLRDAATELNNLAEDNIRANTRR